MPRRPLSAVVAEAAFTPQDEKKLKAGISKYGRQWATIKKKLFSSRELSLIKTKGLSLIKASPESKMRAKKAKRALSKCEKINVDRLRKKFSDRRIRDYLKFLVLKAVEEDYDCEHISPTQEEDEVWHHHLLDTRNYRQVCDELCGEGQFIDHDPDGGMDVEARNERREYAAELREELGFKADQPKLEDPPPPPPPPSADGTSLNIKVADDDGNELFFKMKQTTPLQKLMQAWCNRQGVAMKGVRFLFDGQRFSPNQTPAELEMEEGDMIDVKIEQQGC